MKIRKADLSDAKGIAKVHVDSWRSTYRNMVPQEYLSKLSYEEREKLWIQNMKDTDVFVAVTENGDIVGFANGGKERTGDYIYEGELYAIYLLEHHQSQGIGLDLVKAVVNQLREENLDSMLVWVLSDNNARHFYERIGGRVVDTKPIQIAGTKLLETAYGWEDIRLIK
ncbi:GNAT family N-acetyltransferase [Radiobacillus kanasensis]|uniref:GNAT family N-acetyltransferase n=1 Tax=Radiobacillus kanasensis TaxID=2844358 RepID=UPI001E4785AD|nr:GNAT family N-acetyltransferase [Radiobacillus kanasensis]UFT98372.1 GNAT family N-acetyltransferase [Radiobacillus kanasensis]